MEEVLKTLVDGYYWVKMKADPDWMIMYIREHVLYFGAYSSADPRLMKVIEEIDPRVVVRKHDCAGNSIDKEDFYV